MDIGDVVSGAKLRGIRWALLSAAAAQGVSRSADSTPPCGGCSGADRRKDEMYESFLAGYVPRAPKDFLICVRLCEAVELVKCAVRRVQLFEDDWASRTSELVERSQAVIDDVQRILVLRGRRFPMVRRFDPSPAVMSKYLH